MSQTLSKLTGRVGGLSHVAMAASGGSIILWLYLATRRPRAAPDNVLFVDRHENRKSKGSGADFGKTIVQLRAIMKSIVGAPELALAMGMTVSLLLRTVCDMWQINNGTEIEAAIITADVDRLRSTMMSFVLNMPTLAFVNNILRYFSDALRLRLRYNLSTVLYDKYMTELTFYNIANGRGVKGRQFANVDQLLTADVDKFCASIVELYGNMSKPILDIVLLVHRLTTVYTGPTTPALMIAWLAFAGGILTNARRPMSRLIINETKAEGQLRFVHSRLLQNTEEIAFFRGNLKERDTLMSALEHLRHSLARSATFKFNIGFLDNIVGRYISTVVGYLALSLPFLSSRYANSTGSERLEMYYKSGRMMMNLAQSISRVILAGRDMSKLAAYTERVTALLVQVDTLNRMATCNVSRSSSQVTTPINVVDDDDDDDDEQHKQQQSKIKNQLIEFRNVTLCTPGGDVLCRDLSFTIRAGHNVIIAGPNGSGKSSLFRVLAGLWEPMTSATNDTNESEEQAQSHSGTIVRPEPNQLFYICQRPYMPLGTLRDQIIYPDRLCDMNAKGHDDTNLAHILDIVELKYLLERDQSSASVTTAVKWSKVLDSVADWHDVLSGGEKQRIALARLLYHKPQFAILDECTSAVAIDVEQAIYSYLCNNTPCTLLSVTHRVRQLAKFHHFILEFDGAGGYKFERLIADLST